MIAACNIDNINIVRNMSVFIFSSNKANNDEYIINETQLQ